MKTKKLLFLFVAVTMALSCIGVTAMAAEGSVVTTEDALKSCITSGGVVTLGEDIVINEMITVPQGTTVTLDLNGYDITVKESTDRHIYAINNQGILTLKDSVGTGSISARGIYNGYDGSDTDKTVTGAKMTVESGTYNAIDNNGGAAIFNCAELIINNGTFEGKTAAMNNRAKGDVTINGGTYRSDSGAVHYAIQNNNGKMCINNAIVDRGFGAVGIWGGNTIINGGNFLPTGAAGNTCHVVYVSSNSNVTINGGNFKMNYPVDSVPDSGSAVASYYNGTLSITGGIFTSHFDNVSPVELSTGSEIIGGTYLTPSGETSKHSYITNYVAEGYELSADGSVVKTASPVAKIGDVRYETLKAAITAAVDGDTIEILAGTIEEDSILFPTTLNNVTIKGAADKATILKNTNLGSANGSAVHYNGITIDGIVFDGSQIVFTGARGGEVIYKDWTITNCEFKNIVSTANSAVHFNLASDEVMENFTFTNNIIDSVSGGNISGVRLNYLKGNVTISGNNISNVAWNAVQLINGNVDTFVITNNTLSSGATEGILNLYNINAEALTIAQNKFLVVEGQPGIAYLNSGDVSENYWGGVAPTGLPEGVTYSSYYTDSELTNLVQSNTTKTLPTINLLIQNMPTGTMTDANGNTVTTYKAGCFAAIDSTAYSALGIEVRADGGKVTGKPTTEYLYTYITVTDNGVDTIFYPKDFGETNKYIFGRIIETPTNYTDFSFRPFAVSLDGKTTLYGNWSKEYTIDPQ